MDCGGPCPACPPLVETDCTDGLDEDFDGPTDCQDPDCAPDPACQTPAGLFRVLADDRDADWNPVEGVQLGNFFNRSQICIGRDGTRTWQIGLQFSVDLPVPVTITDARLALTSSGDNAGSFTTRIRAVAQDDLAPFVPGTPGSFTTSYPLTASFADWMPPAEPLGVTVESPDLRAAVQEVVDRPGWLPGNSIGFVLTESLQDGIWRCLQDSFAATGEEAVLEVGYYAQGSPVCLDARGAPDELAVLREPPGGCPLAPGGPARDFVFGDVDALSLVAGAVDLGTVRCAGGGSGTTEEVVRSADPDPPSGARFYLWRFAGAPDFGNGRLADASAPPRLATSAIPCP